MSQTTGCKLSGAIYRQNFADNTAVGMFHIFHLI